MTRHPATIAADTDGNVTLRVRTTDERVSAVWGALAAETSYEVVTEDGDIYEEFDIVSEDGMTDALAVLTTEDAAFDMRDAVLEAIDFGERFMAILRP